MQLRTNFLSRFLVVFRPDPSSLPPVGNSDVCSSSPMDSESDPPCTESRGSYQAMEIPDSDEESDLEATATTPDGTNSTILSGGSPVEPYSSARNRSLSDFSGASPGPGESHFDSSEVWFDEDTDDVRSSLTASMPSFGASLRLWKDVLSDPRSSIWKGRGGAKMAVVLWPKRKNKGKLDNASTLRALSASKQNVIAGKKDRSQEKVSTSRNRTGTRPRHHGELHNARMAPHPEQSSSRSLRPRAQRSYTEPCDVEMEDDQPETSSDQDEDYKAQECDSDVDNSEDERVDSASNAADDEAYISDNDDVNAVESEDEGPSPKRAKTADSESGDEEEGGEDDEQNEDAIEQKSTSKKPRAPAKKKRSPKSGKKSIPGLDEDNHPYTFAEQPTPYKFAYENVLDYESKPLTTIPEIFEDFTDKLYEKFTTPLGKFCSKFGEKPLNVLTFCSGTESPILAMNMVQKTLEAKYPKCKFVFNHKGSAEIHPAKAAYIEKNFDSEAIFRDIIEIIPLEDKAKPHFLTTMYGGEAKIPGDVDLLVAGFACDDFSTLNNVRKTLEEKGESGDTFFAVKMYMHLYHPKLVVLENVMGAPWTDESPAAQKKNQTSIAAHLDQIGYHTIHLKVDTKEYYLPHTRQRGYMVCIDRASMPADTKWAAMEAACTSMIESLKRTATVPVEAMLFNADDPRLQVLLDHDKKCDNKVVKWDRCKIGHLDYCQVHGLGDRHPITNWKPDGSKEMPDFHKPMPGMTERVADSMDVAHKRNLARGFDDRYYNRLLELSQNVYRVEDSTRNGIQGCLTPTNMAFSTVQGRRITGAEAARLQGIDLDQVDTTNMPESLLLDMSGNAMTSTVVGTVIFAALLTFQDIFNVEHRAPAILPPEPSPSHEGEEALVQVESNSAEYVPVTVNKITSLARSTCRLCHCEGRHEIFATTFQKCRLCGHTACRKCGKSPRHEYERFQVDFTKARKNPLEFAELIKKSIPKEINLGALYSNTTESFLTQIAKDIIPQGFDHDSWNKAMSAVRNALKSRVFFRNSRRRESWVITYDSPEAILKLNISGDRVEWLLYANASQVPLGSPIGQYLRQFPIARMTPKGSDIVKGVWGYWLPQKKVFKATVTSSGPLISTYKNGTGLASALHQFNHSYVTVAFDSSYDPRYFSEDIQGTYIASPMCGQAFSTMHLHADRKPGQKPLGLFFDHEQQTGDPSQHCFKFGHDFRRKDCGEYVEVVAQFPASWRQPIIQGRETNDATDVKILGSEISSRDFLGMHTDQVNVTVHGRWVTLGNHSLSLSGSRFTYSQLPVDISHLDLTCGKEAVIFSCKGKINYKISCLLPKNKWTQIDRTNRATFWPEFSWALQQGLQINGHREANSNWHDWSDIIDDCLTCAPTPPALLWTLNRKGKHVPYEDPEQASKWERSMKRRPSPVRVLFYIDNHGNMALSISMNAVTLMHRAQSRLLINGPSSDTKLSWRLVTDHGQKEQPMFKPLTLKNNDNVKMASQPFKNSPYKLRDEQLRVLTWLLEKEVKGTTFTEEEVVESLIRDIGYRAEGRASRNILRHGGVLAQDVGFGKTVVMLGLINERRKAGQAKAKIIGDIPGAIYTPATLILLPPHLVNQWQSEVQKFLPGIPKEKIIVIGGGQAQKFGKLTIQQILDAEFVIVSWECCTKAPYLKMLANLAGLVEPAEKAGNRAFDAWYKTALARVEQNIDMLRDNLEGFVEHLESQWSTSVKEASSVDVRVPSKHVTGASYVNSEKRQSPQSEGESTSKKRKRNASTEQPEAFKHTIKFLSQDNWESMNCAILELFSWARILIDEHTYNNGWVATILANLKADSYFMLSGTPALGGHSDVKPLAKLLKINLGVDDFTGLRSDIFNKKTSDLTKSEVFLAYQEDPSPMWKWRRHQHTQAWLNDFCRQDAAKIGDIKYTTHYHLVDLSASELAMYLELLQHLAATDFVLKRATSSKKSSEKPFKNDRADQIEEVVTGTGDAKPALFLRASQFTFLGVQEDISDLCDGIMKLRKKQYKAWLTTFDDHLRRTFWLYKRVEIERKSGEAPCTKFPSFENRVRGHKFGDQDVSKALESRLEQAPGNYREEDWGLWYRKPGTKIKADDPNPLPELPTGQNTSHGVTHITRMAFELRTWVTKLNTLIEEIIKQRRALRFFENILYIQRNNIFACAHCGTTGLPATEVKVMGGCGHLLAKECCSGDDVCPVLRCGSFNREYQKLVGSDLGQAGSEQCSKYGSKMDAIRNLIEGITQTSDDKILVSVQFSQSTIKLEEALEAAHIPFSDLRKETTSSKVLQSFQNGTSPCKGGQPSRVLIMNIGDANASGSNLTVANHVIFLQPYYTTGENAQAKYEAAMTQAVGRAKRYGQTKEVHIYHFLTVNTIDIDYYEARNSCVISRKGKFGKAYTLGDPQPAGPDTKTELGTYFASTMEFDGVARSDY